MGQSAQSGDSDLQRRLDDLRRGKWCRWGFRGRLHIALACVVGTLALLLLAAIVAPPPDAPSSSRLIGTAVLVLLVVCFAVGIRAALDGVRVTEDALIVRNDFKTHVLPWEEIDSIFVPSRTSSVAVRLRSARLVNVKGIAGLNPSLFPAAADVPRAFASALSETLAQRTSD